MTLGILDIVVISLIFCIEFCFFWIAANIVWKIIEGKILVSRQNELMDRIYSKAIRLGLQFIQDFKSLKEVAGRDKM